MKLRTLATSALLALTLASPVAAQETPAEPAALALGSRAPMADAALRNVDGKDMTLAAAAKGRKGLLVVFTCNHCPWVKRWEQRIAEAGNAAVRSGLAVVAINSNDPEVTPEDGFDGMRQRAKDLKLRFPYVVDATSDVARAFGATRTPEAFLFDAGGALVYHGTIDDNARSASEVKERYLVDAITAVAAGKPVAQAQTKALGCSIKFRKKA
jgi:peroxiredoxin